MFRYLPEQASEIAPKIDWIHNVITDLSVLFTVLIVGSMLYFAVRYRKQKGVDHRTPRILGDHKLEIIWTVVPTVISIYIMYYGLIYHKELRTVPKDALTIQVTGQKWFWTFKYENGKETSNEFVVPVNTPIKMLMKSKDVIHSFYIPAMRVKRDVLPSQYSYLSFTPVKIGEYHSFCTEYCGSKHYDMYAKLKVVSKAEYKIWLEQKENVGLSPMELGKKLYVAKGCNACHSLNGTKVIGPTYLKSYGREVELDTGEKVTADENYLRNSILYSNSQIVKGYPKNIMPVYEGQLDDNQVSALVAFIKAQDGSLPVEEEEVEEQEEGVELSAGEKLYKAKLCSTCHSIDGSKIIGPSFKNLYERKGELQDGTEYVANDEYITRSILKPMDQIVKGYPAAMPAYEGQLSEEEIQSIIDYIKTLK